MTQKRGFPFFPLSSLPFPSLAFLFFLFNLLLPFFPFLFTLSLPQIQLRSLGLRCDLSQHGLRRNAGYKRVLEYSSIPENAFGGYKRHFSSVV